MGVPSRADVGTTITTCLLDDLSGMVIPRNPAAHRICVVACT
jgi:hypothetical protein